MLIYCDTVIPIYYFDHVGVLQQRAVAYIAAMTANGDAVAISDLVRLEYRVGPLKSKDVTKLNTFDRFCTGPQVRKMPLTAHVFDLAAEIRAGFGFKLADSIHLAAAELGGCDRFLTNDARLARFTAIPIEILP